MQDGPVEKLTWEQWNAGDLLADTGHGAHIVQAWLSFHEKYSAYFPGVKIIARDKCMYYTIDQNTLFCAIWKLSEHRVRTQLEQDFPVLWAMFLARRDSPDGGYLPGE